MTDTATQAYMSTAEAMKTLSMERFNSLKNAAEALRNDARKLQEDLDLRSRWISTIREKAKEDPSEECRALIDDCDSFAKYMEEINEVIKGYDEWLGRLEKF